MNAPRRRTRKPKLRWPRLRQPEYPIGGFCVSDMDPGQLIIRDDVLEPWGLDSVTPEAAEALSVEGRA